MDVTLKVPGLEKLLDYAASGIGAIAGPMLAKWRASREGKARLTSTLADVEVRRIETESKARSLPKYGLDFDNLNVLHEHGLIIPDYNSWRDYQASIGIRLPEHTQGVLRIPFSFQGRHWIFSSTAERAANQEFRISGVALTQSGRELLRVVGLEPMNEYAQDLMKFLQTKNLRMIKVDSPLPQ